MRPCLTVVVNWELVAGKVSDRVTRTRIVLSSMWGKLGVLQVY